MFYSAHRWAAVRSASAYNFEREAYQEGLALNDVRVVAALVTALTAAAIFFMGKIWEMGAEYMRFRARRHAMVSAIFTEIRRNVEDLELSLEAIPDMTAIRAKFEARPDANVLIVYSRNMVYFDSMPRDMTDLAPDTLEAVVRFYSALEKVYRSADSAAGETYRTLSIDGKINVLENIDDHMRAALAFGHEALRDLRSDFGQAVLGRQALRSPKDPDHASSSS